MLGFTHHHQNNTRSGQQDLDFEPLIISKRPPVATRAGFPKQTHKDITKTVSNQKKWVGPKPSTKADPRAGRSSDQPRGQWVARGKIDTFDRNLRKNALAEEQRRIRAELKKDRNESIRQLTRREKGIRGKAIELQKGQQAEIEQLKRMIEKERQEKAKNQQAYEARLAQIQKERQQLLRLQRKIQEKGVRNQKQYKQQIAVLHKNQYPTNDRGKCYPEPRGVMEGRSPAVQLESPDQRQQLRQKQLELLYKQRERCIAEQPSVNYNPTIVPLLSRASYKIVSTHVSTLVELLVDDLLEEQVYMLEEIELNQHAQRQKLQEKEVMRDYCQMLEGFVQEAQVIEDRVGKYSTLQFQDLYFPKHYSPQKSQPKTVFNQTYGLEGLDPDTLEEIENRRERFIRFVGNFDEYKKGHLTMFEKVTEELIDDAIQKMAVELDRGSNDFVQLMFRKQFQ